MFKEYLYYIGFRIYDIFNRNNDNTNSVKNTDNLNMQDMSKDDEIYRKDGNIYRKRGYKEQKDNSKRRKSSRYNKRKKYIFQKCVVLIAAVLWLIAALNMLWGISGYGFLNFVAADSKNTLNNGNRIAAAFGGTFEGMSFKRVQGSVSVYAKYCNTTLTGNAKDIILEQIADKIGIDRYTINEAIEDENSVRTLAQCSASGDVICKFITVDKGVKGADVSQYIYIGITLNNSIDTIFTYEKIVNDILDSLNIDAQVTVNLKGTIDGYLDTEKKDIITNTILDKTGAVVVAQKKDGQMYTVYGYDKKIEEYIMSVNDKININISMSYDKKNNETYVYYSTPLNNEDY